MKKFKEFVLNRTFISVYLISLIVVCSIMSVVYYLDVAKDKDEMNSLARTTGFEIYDSISFRTDDLYILEAYLIESKGEINDNVNQICELIYKSNDNIQSICLAPKGIVEFAYPIFGNEKVVGFDINDDIQENELAKDAIINGKAHIQGPYMLVQGVEALVIRYPIYLSNNDYWGIVSIALRYPQALYDSIETLEEIEETGRLYRISEVDPITNEEILLAESSKPVSNKYESITYTHSLYNTSLKITMSRNKAWYQEGTFIFALLIGLLIPIIVAYLYKNYRLKTERSISEKIEQQEATIEKQGKKEKLNKDLINILASEYAAVYVVNLDTDDFETCALSPYMQERFGDLFATLNKYVPAIKLYVDNFVADESKEKMYAATTKENVYLELKDKKSFTRTFTNKQGLFCEMKFVKTENADEEPHVVALGFAEKNIEIGQDKKMKEELRLAKERAEEASNAKTTFLFNMSHDIRTPMNAIIGFTNIAKKHMDDSECVEDCLNKVEASSEHLLSLINDILDMSRIESGNIEIDNQPVNVEQASRKVTDLISSSALKKSLSFNVSLNIEHNYVLADELRVSRVITNILGNAIKYTNPGGRVDFTLNETKAKRKGCYGYDFIIADTGIGISKEFKEHIFDSFSREKNSTTSGVQGTGLGMTITKQLVDLMKGTIKIDSKVGVGTTVKVHFEFKPAEETIKEEIAIKEKQLAGKKVLLVEDNELNREIAKDILLDEEMVVFEATDGLEAVKMIEEANDAKAYDFVLMDIQMPYMNGYEATVAIRKLKIKGIKDLPIIAMTANAFEEDKKKAFESGMNAHIAKPIDIPILINTLIEFM